MGDANGTAIVPVQQKVNEFGGTLQKMLPQLKAALPRHIKPERFARIVLTAVRKVPDILECTPESVMGSIVTAAQIGLEPDGVLGEAWLVPYNEKGRDGVWRKVCQLIIGYQGFIKLAWQSGMVDDVYAELVYEKDAFKWHLGTDRKIVHRPSMEADRGAVTHVYAAAKIKGGGTPFVVLTIAAVEKIRERSRAKNGPWQTDYDAMAKKTAVRQLQKWIPKSKEQARAAALDELVDADLSQGMGAVIDAVSDTPAIEGSPQAQLAGPPKTEGTRVSLKKDANAPSQPPGAPTTVKASTPPPAEPGPGPEARTTTAVANGKEGAAAAGKLQSVQGGKGKPTATKPADDGGDIISKPPAAEEQRELTYAEQEAANAAAAAPDDDELPPWMKEPK